MAHNLGIAAESAHWLAYDFQRTGEMLLLALSPVRYLLHAMLDVCIATFCELAVRCAKLVLEPPPPRVRICLPTKPIPNQIVRPRRVLIR